MLAGNVAAGARAIRWLEDRDPRSESLLATLLPHCGRAHLVGITGPPGAGKSTLVDASIEHLRSKGMRVGVVAVDPSSPYTGGAVLGDRVRMQRHATDPGVFIRSMGTRGDLGGLAHATFDAMAVMDAMGYQVVIVETVGVGQDEVDIARLAHTTVVLSVPGLGDEVQAIKAGVLETGDLFVINKADRPEAPALRRQLELMLHLGSLTAPEATWQPPLLETIAHTSQGVDALWSAIDQHREHITAAGSLAQRLGERCQEVFLQTLREEIARETVRMMQQMPGYAALCDAVRARQRDPYSAAHTLLDEFRRSRRDG